MSKKKADPDATIENRVYLFKDLASAWLVNHPNALGSKDEEQRKEALRALADLAYVSCVVADTGHLTAAEVARQVRDGRADDGTS